MHLQYNQDALQGRENPLSDANPNLDRGTLEDEVREEMELQFEVQRLQTMTDQYQQYTYWKSDPNGSEINTNF